MNELAGELAHEGLTQADWQTRYCTQNTPWDLNQPARAFEALATQGWFSGRLNLPDSVQVLVPGCGRGHDAACFARAGHQVTGLDFSAEAIAQAQQQYGSHARFVVADAFDETALPPASFDAVIEHTFFCAIEPTHHAAYLQAVLRWLKPGGRLYGIFWLHGKPGGPPFSTTLEALQTLFTAAFKIIWLAPNPYAGNGTHGQDRSAKEWLMVLEKVFDSPLER
ncbi:MAG: methyltransferase domain-containing protein [Vampirovibrionales bacterium]|nr:methyltransferase domain-containing protein [Vampirovibrionales bacterium]